MFRAFNRFFMISGLLFIFFSVYSGKVSADEIVLENNDRLTGTVTGIENGILTLTTGYSEPIKIRVEKIKKIITDKPSSAPPGKWKGGVTIGANLQSGNTDRASASVGAEATRRTEQHRFSLRFLFNYAEEDGELSARNTYGAFKYDYFFTKKLYGYSGIELLSDEFKDLNLRTVAGPGVGYQIWNNIVKSLLFESGVSYFSEDLDKGEDDHWVTARLAGNLTLTIFGPITFSDYLIVYPSLEDFGEYQLRNEASLLSPLASGWALKFANILESDSDPPAGVKKSDLNWILGLEYKF